MIKKINRYGTAALRDVGTDPGNVPVLDAEGKLVAGVLPTSGVPSGLIMISYDGSVPAGWEQVDSPLGAESSSKVVSPIMTGPTTGDWTATESAPAFRGAFWKTFDGTVDGYQDWYYQSVSEIYGVLECTHPFTFNSYTVTAPGSDTNLTVKSWRMQYWDGGNWQTAHTVTGETGWAASETRSFNMPQTVTTTKIRFYIDESNSPPYVMVGEIELLFTPVWVRKI